MLTAISSTIQRLNKSTIKQINDSSITYFDEPKNCRSNYWLNCILLKDKKQRDEFLKISNEAGVMTRPAWQLMSRLPMFTHCQHDDLKNSIWFEERVVNIPSSVIV